MKVVLRLLRAVSARFQEEKLSTMCQLSDDLVGFRRMMRFALLERLDLGHAHEPCGGGGSWVHW